MSSWQQNNIPKKHTMEYLRLKEKILLEKNKMYNLFYHPFKQKNNFYTKKEFNYIEKIESNNTDCITVCIITHNRTNVACATIQYLIKNLKYNNLKWCISDDRSDKGHIEKLISLFKENGIEDVKVCRSTPDSYGLGAALNKALKYSWENGNLSLTVEDDWILQRELDLKKYADVLLNDPDTSMVRLAYLDKRHQLSDYNNFLYKVGKSLFNFIFNNQCGLRHKRIYDAMGYNKENCNGDKQEEDLRDKYNSISNFGKHYKVLFPKELAIHTFDDPSLYFIHAGKSTNGHTWYEVPKRFRWIYDADWLKKINKINTHPIVLITDEKYTKNVEKMIRQIRKYTDTKIYIFCWNRSAADKLYEKCCNNIRIVNINQEMRDFCIECAGDLSNKKGYFVPPVGLLKFLIPEILKENTALYMDCDIIINQQFCELLYMDLDDYYCGATKDPYRIKKDVSDYPVMNAIPGYFNSGVLLLNLDLMRKNNISKLLFETKKNLEYKVLMDQDTFNIVMQGHVKFLDNKYNSLIPVIHDLLELRKDITLDQINEFYNKKYNKYIDIVNEAVFTHFAGGWAKPWNNKEYKSRWDKI